jgi:hypothetical protein
VQSDRLPGHDPAGRAGGILWKTAMPWNLDWSAFAWRLVDLAVLLLIVALGGWLVLDEAPSRTGSREPPSHAGDHAGGNAPTGAPRNPTGHLTKLWLLALLAVCFALPAAPSAAPGDSKDRRAELTLHARPSTGFAPARIVVTAQLHGAGDEDLYCPTVEWDWGDGTLSRWSADCDPFVPGKSVIQRSFIRAHVYHLAGSFTVELRPGGNQPDAGRAA